MRDNSKIVCLTLKKVLKEEKKSKSSYIFRMRVTNKKYYTFNFIFFRIIQNNINRQRERERERKSERERERERDVSKRHNLMSPKYINLKKRMKLRS